MTTSALAEALDLLRTAVAEQAHAGNCSAWGEAHMLIEARWCDCWLRDAAELLESVEAPPVKPWKD